jgi:hypothetical protein
VTTPNDIRLLAGEARSFVDRAYPKARKVIITPYRDEVFVNVKTSDGTWTPTLQFVQSGARSRKEYA